METESERKGEVAEKSYRPKAEAENLTIDVTVDVPEPPKDGGPGLGVKIVRVGTGNLSWPVDESALERAGGDVLDVVANHPLVTDQAPPKPQPSAASAGDAKGGKG